MDNLCIICLHCLEKQALNVDDDDSEWNCKDPHRQCKTRPLIGTLFIDLLLNNTWSIRPWSLCVQSHQQACPSTECYTPVHCHDFLLDNRWWPNTTVITRGSHSPADVQISNIICKSWECCISCWSTSKTNRFLLWKEHHRWTYFVSSIFYYYVYKCIYIIKHFLCVVSQVHEALCAHLARDLHSDGRPLYIPGHHNRSWPWSRSQVSDIC